MDFNSIRDKISELLTVENAKSIINKAQSNAPTRQQVETSIKTLQDVLHNIYEKGVTGASNVSTIYQQTVNAPQVESIVAMIYKTKTPEVRQRNLEKILYLYLLNFGVNDFTPPIDLQTMTEGDKVRFFDRLLADDGTYIEEVKRMVRELLLLFNNERLGISAVEYNTEFADDETMAAMYEEIIDVGRSRDIMDRVNSQVNDKEFLKFFLSEIIEDVPNRVANDTKYFGQGNDYVAGIRLRLRNFIKAHNVYVKNYIKDGRSLEKAIPKLNRIIETIDKDIGLSEDKETMNALRAVTEKIKAGIQTMVNESRGDEINVYEIESLDDLLRDTSKSVNKGQVITKGKNVDYPKMPAPPAPDGPKRDRSDDESDEEEGSDKKQQRRGTPEIAEDIDGGKRRRRRKTHKMKSRRRFKGGKRKTLKRKGKKSKKVKRSRKGKKGKKITRRKR